jgi:hypothetical protein
MHGILRALANDYSSCLFSSKPLRLMAMISSCHLVDIHSLRIMRMVRARFVTRSLR